MCFYIHLQAVDDYYKSEGAEKGPDCSFLFDTNSNKISVDIPPGKDVEHDGWMIFSLATSNVSDVLFHTISLTGTKLLHVQVKKDILDSFEPGRRPCSLQLKAEALNKEVRTCHYFLYLKGTNQPETGLLLELDPTSKRGIVIFGIVHICMYVGIIIIIRKGSYSFTAIKYNYNSY